MSPAFPVAPALAGVLELLTLTVLAFTSRSAVVETVLIPMFPAVTVPEKLALGFNSTVNCPELITGLPVTVSESLLILISVNMPLADTVTFPLLPESDIPLPATSLVTPVFVTVIVPVVVIGPPLICTPVPATNPTLVTEPDAGPLATDVTLPYASTVNVGFE